MMIHPVNTSSQFFKTGLLYSFSASHEVGLLSEEYTVPLPDVFHLHIRIVAMSLKTLLGTVDP
jgi:hypothetical protein